MKRGRGGLWAAALAVAGMAMAQPAPLPWAAWFDRLPLVGQGPGLPAAAAASGPWAAALAGPPELLLAGLAGLVDRLAPLDPADPGVPRALLAWADAAEAGPQPAPARPAPCPHLPDDPARLDGWLPPDLPEPWRQALRPVVAALREAEAARARLWAGPGPQPSPAAVLEALRGGLAGTPPPLAAWARGLDPAARRDGALALACAAEALHRAAAGAAALPAGRWAWAHADGEVLVDARPGHAGRHAIARPWLVLDLAGDDTYHLGSPEGLPQAGVKLLLDAGGDDEVWALAPAGDAAAALLGWSLHWDLGRGRDRHRGGWIAQGAAVLGVAWALDDGGDGEDQASVLAQGAALAGWAFKLAGPGHDRRQAASLAQAAAGPGGVALLADLGGDDRHTLEDPSRAWPSPQDPGLPVSMGQGVGFGHPAEAGPPAPAGLALAFDRGGHDRHRAAVFAQGVGLWGGLGLWVDAAGGGDAEADWHAQGAAAHGGLGLMAWGPPGPARVQARRVQAQGAGHDRGWGLFLAAAGEGVHQVQDLGLGSGHEGGWGHFLHEGRPGPGASSWPCRGAGRLAGPGGLAWSSLAPGPACADGGAR